MSGIRERSIVAQAQALRDECARGADPGVPTTPTSSPSSLDEARAQRRELYVLLAVCAEQVVGDFVTIVRRSEPSDVSWGAGEMTASAHFADLLQRTIDRFFAENGNQWRDGARTAPIAPLLARIDQLGPQSSAVLDKPCFHYAERLLHTGMRSITPVAPGVMSAIVELASGAGASVAPDDVAKIAVRSVRVAFQLAALNLSRSSDIQVHLIDAETLQLDLRRARLAGDLGRERIEVDVPEFDPASMRAERLPPAYDFTIGCPSLIRLGSTSALEQLWRWTVDVAAACGYLGALTACAR
jgi:hypothetical protein